MKYIPDLTYDLIEEARKTLGLFDIVTAEEVKLAYRELAKKYHPDRNEHGNYDDREFKEINKAYRVLMSLIRRYNYSPAVLNLKKGQAVMEEECPIQGPLA